MQTAVREHASGAEARTSCKRSCIVKGEAQPLRVMAVAAQDDARAVFTDAPENGEAGVGDAAVAAAHGARIDLKHRALRAQHVGCIKCQRKVRLILGKKLPAFIEFGKQIKMTDEGAVGFSLHVCHLLIILPGELQKIAGKMLFNALAQKPGALVHRQIRSIRQNVVT